MINLNHVKMSAYCTFYDSGEIEIIFANFKKKKLTETFLPLI